MSELTVQRGLLVCTRTCQDDLILDTRDAIIAQILASDSPTHPEGADHRWVDRAFMEDNEFEGLP
jgi:hypothetical protein